MNQNLLKAEELQNLLLAAATGGLLDEKKFREIRREFIEDESISPRLPRFVHTCTTLSQFRPYMQQVSPGYAGRRDFIWGGFKPLLEYLENPGDSPHQEQVNEGLARLESPEVRRAWDKALERRVGDPEGAITAARTLLESVCKGILDDLGVEYENDGELPKLYRQVTDSLSRTPDKTHEKIINQILGGSANVVAGLGALRN